MQDVEKEMVEKRFCGMLFPGVAHTRPKRYFSPLFLGLACLGEMWGNTENGFYSLLLWHLFADLKAT
jgi:hypothetical protein